MNLLLVGNDDRQNDQVVIDGAKKLLNLALGRFTSDFIYISNDIPADDYDLPHQHVPYDAIVVIGTPWLWDGFGESVKYQNLLKVFEKYIHKKRVFIGAGSCFPLYYTPKFETKDLAKLFGEATVFCRDPLIKHHLKDVTKSVLLPCPSFWAWKDRHVSLKREKPLFVWHSPTLGISAETFDNKLLEAYSKTAQSFVSNFDADVMSPDGHIVSGELLFKRHIYVPKDLDDQFNHIARASIVVSTLVHSAAIAWSLGKPFNLIATDSRAQTIADFGGKIELPGKVYDTFRGRTIPSPSSAFESAWIRQLKEALS